MKIEVWVTCITPPHNFETFFLYHGKDGKYTYMFEDYHVRWGWFPYLPSIGVARLLDNIEGTLI